MTISAPDADDPLPGDHRVAVHLRLARPAAAAGADAVALEDAELAARRARSRAGARPTSSPRTSWTRPSGRPDSVTTFRLEELGEAHQDPGSLPDERAPSARRRGRAAAPRPGASSFTTDVTESTSRHGTCTALPESRRRASRGSPRERQALPPTRISTTSGESPSSPAISRSSTLPQFMPVAVDELVVEDAERDVDLDVLAHPWPPFVSSISGIAAIAIAMITMK